MLIFYGSGSYLLNILRAKIHWCLLGYDTNLYYRAFADIYIAILSKKKTYVGKVSSHKFVLSTRCLGKMHEYSRCVEFFGVSDAAQFIRQLTEELSSMI